MGLKRKLTAFSLTLRRQVLIALTSLNIEIESLERSQMISIFFMIPGERLIDVRDNLVQMFDDVVDIASTNYDAADKARVTISHSGMAKEIFVHLQDLSNISGETIMNRFEKVLNSNEEMAVDNTFNISVGLMRLHKGGGRNKWHRPLPLLPHLNNSLYSAIARKRALVEIVCAADDHLCAAKAIVVCKLKLDKLDKRDSTKFNNLIRKYRQCTTGKVSSNSGQKATT